MKTISGGIYFKEGEHVKFSCAFIVFEVPIEYTGTVRNTELELE